MSDPMLRLRDLAVSDTGFVFDPYSGATFSTNPVGLEILAGLKNTQTRAEIVASLNDKFEVVESADDIERDIDEFIQLLKRNRIVENEFHLD